MLVGDTNQLVAVDVGEPFAQLQQAGMKTAITDEILRQLDVSVEASRAGKIGVAFEKLGVIVTEVKADSMARGASTAPRSRVIG